MHVHGCTRIKEFERGASLGFTYVNSFKLLPIIIQLIHTNKMPFNKFKTIL